MTEETIISLACELAFSVSGWQRYVRVNDHVVDTVERNIVAIAWPRMTRGAFPIRAKAASIAALILQ